MQRGRIIVLIGTDGSGKTTIANLIEKHYNNLGLRTVRLHWRPEFLPSPRRFIGQKPICNPTNPHSNPPHSTIVSVLLLLYYYLDFLIGYFIRLKPAKSHYSLIIIERYFYDTIFDPIRHRLKGIFWLSNILSKIIPNPDYIILLHGNPSVLHLRKQELTKSDIIQQQKIMFKYSKTKKNVVKADVTYNNPAKIVSLIIKAISY